MHILISYDLADLIRPVLLCSTNLTRVRSTQFHHKHSKKNWIFLAQNGCWHGRVEVWECEEVLRLPSREWGQPCTSQSYCQRAWIRSIKYGIRAKRVEHWGRMWQPVAYCQSSWGRQPWTPEAFVLIILKGADMRWNHFRERLSSISEVEGALIASLPSKKWAQLAKSLALTWQRWKPGLQSSSLESSHLISPFDKCRKW